MDLELSLSSQEEAVYTSAQDESGGEMSDRVSTLAGSIYAEFERMIQRYGSDVVENLMPMVINVLEQLDASYNEGNEQSVELELLAEDNEQLMTQYEREKQLRKLAESKYLEYEDSREQDRQELQTIIEQLEHARRQSENKIKQLQDQVERSEERYADQKKEYDTLHKRHTEMLHAYMERIEIESKFSPSPCASDMQIFPPRSPHTIAQGLISSSQPNLLNVSSSKLDKHKRQDSSSSTQLFKSEEFTESRNNLSFDDEFSHETKPKDQNAAVSPKKKLAAAHLMASNEAGSDRIDTSCNNFKNLDSDINIPMDRLGHDTNEISNETTVCSQARDLQNLNVSEMTQAFDSPFIDSSEATSASSLYLSPEARAILESTPELMKTHSRLADTPMSALVSTVKPSLDIQNAQKQQKLDASLYSELQYLENNENGGEIEHKGLKEFDLLLKENKGLIDVRDKLQTQKNDLIRRLEELSSDKEIQQEEINGLQTTKQRMKLKIGELEQTLKKVRLENEKAQITLKNKMSEERIPSASRKRFTRVEMAKVLMERNQYKERLMELQEAVRWTEMIRASKENHVAALQDKKKNRSTIWRLFSNLFTGTNSSTNTSPRKTPQQQQQPINVWYGSQNSNPAGRRHTLNSNPLTPNRYSGDVGFEGLTERQRQERRERYKLVKEHINSEGRKQAYGWSLPSTYASDTPGQLAVPIPVYCRPLNTEAAMKIWCASGVNLRGGRTPEGNYLGLPQDFQAPLISTVWIGTSTHSCSKVTIIDANHPSNALDQFIVSSSHLLCMAAVPGLELDVTETDGRPLIRAEPSKSVKSPAHGPRQTSPEHGANVMGIQAEEESFQDDEVDGSSVSFKYTSVLPTMWLGAQSGKIYIHSVIGNWKKCLQSAKLKDSLLSIVHIQNRVLVALADGTVAIFRRKPDGRWDLSNYHLLDLGRPHHSIRCMTPVHDFVWCGYRNKVQVINPLSMKIEKSFDAHPRRESQVRQLACIGDGVWVSIRLDSTLRLYNAHTYHHLQDVDIEPYVSKMLGTGKFGFSFVRITALLLTNDRLFVGTGNGIILSVPLVSARPSREEENSSNEKSGTGPDLKKRQSDGSEALFMPYCAMVHAQLSFHGHRDSVKFFLGVPGTSRNIDAAKAYSMAGARPPSPSNVGPAIAKEERLNKLIMSGGEGYIDFRVGDDEQEDVKSGSEASPKIVAVERSHLLVWEVES